MSEKPMTLDELFATHKTEQQLQFEREQIPGTPEHAAALARTIADAARRATEDLLVVDEPDPFACAGCGCILDDDGTCPECDEEEKEEDDDNE